MARPKKDQANTTSVVEQNEKTTEVEQNETPAAAENTPAVDEKPEETPETKPEENEKPAEEKPVNIKDNAKVIIKWGGNIENDTIVFSGGWGEYKVPYISEITINGKELKKDESFGRENHFIYTKVMSPKK